MAVEPVANRHDPEQTDTLRSLIYDGLTLMFYDVTGGAALLQEVAVTGPGYETNEGIGVGSTRVEVEAAFGSPVQTADGDPVYELFEGPEDPTGTYVRVTYEGERATALRWQFYVD